MKLAQPDKKTAQEYNEISFLRAAEEGHIESVRLLLDVGVLDQGNELSQQAIALAKQNGHNELARILEERTSQNDNSPASPES